MPSSVTFKVGDYAEYKPSYPKEIDLPFIGEVGQIIRMVENYAVLRFEDGTERQAYMNFLSWQPSPADIEADKARFREEHMRQKRASRGPANEKHGNPRTCPPPNRY